jgi:hypothetical protein
LGNRSKRIDQRRLDRLVSKVKTISRVGENMNTHNLYLSASGDVYYQKQKYKKEDTLLLSKVNPDVVWKLNFNVEEIIKYYKG